MCYTYVLMKYKMYFRKHNLVGINQECQGPMCNKGEFTGILVYLIQFKSLHSHETQHLSQLNLFVAKINTMTVTSIITYFMQCKMQVNWQTGISYNGNTVILQSHYKRGWFTPYIVSPVGFLQDSSGRIVTELHNPPNLFHLWFTIFYILFQRPELNIALSNVKQRANTAQVMLARL